MKRKRSRAPTGDRSAEPVAGVRIIGGSMRGRPLQYSGDVRTRPMKDRVREALFNLIGPRVVGTRAIDLFAGTGALGLEALSRGSVGATLIERHLPTTRLIEQNAAGLGVQDQVEIVFSDTFYWVSRFTPSPDVRLTVFCSPPYEFYVSRRDEMLQLVGRLIAIAPPGSVLAVEADERFDFGLLPQPEQWNVRAYSPAVVGIFET
jgi:16S rRNA (guanine966-N2)-methyltransferase